MYCAFDHNNWSGASRPVLAKHQPACRVLRAAIFLHRRSMPSRRMRMLPLRRRRWTTAGCPRRCCRANSRTSPPNSSRGEFAQRALIAMLHHGGQAMQQGLCSGWDTQSRVPRNSWIDAY